MDHAEAAGTPTPAAPPPSPLGEHLRAPSLRAAMLVQQEALAAAREFLRAQGFTELLPPLIGPDSGPPR